MTAFSRHNQGWAQINSPRKPERVIVIRIDPIIDWTMAVIAVGVYFLVLGFVAN